MIDIKDCMPCVCVLDKETCQCRLVQQVYPPAFWERWYCWVLWWIWKANWNLCIRCCKVSVAVSSLIC